MYLYTKSWELFQYALYETLFQNVMTVLYFPYKLHENKEAFWERKKKGVK